MRLFQRLRDEHDYTGSYATVNRYASPLLAKREVFMELVFGPAEELQIDWGQAQALLDGVRTTVHLFCARCSSSGASFTRAYLREDRLSFLDAHDHALRFFGGLHKRYCYDNLAAAVISRPGPKAKQDKQAKRVLTDAFRALRSHYGMFDLRFCSPGKGNEKGHVENLVKYAQRTFLCPLVACRDLEALNAQLLVRCKSDLSRTIGDTTRQALLAQCQEVMAPLPEPFRASKSASTIANKFSCVRYENCQYSVPIAFAHQPCVVTCYANTVTIESAGRLIAEHPRASSAESFQLDFTHYLDHLERKKGWLKNGRAFRPENLPVPLRRFRCELLQRFGNDGLERLVKILLLYQQHSAADINAALTDCMERGMVHEGAVLQALMPRPAVRDDDATLAIEADSILAVASSPGRSAADYDVLLSQKKAS